MTAIAGIEEDGKVWIGGDSAASSRYSQSIRNEPKVFKVEEFLFGSTGSIRMKQIINHNFTPPTRFEGEDQMSFLVTRFVPLLRRCFEVSGLAMDEDYFPGGLLLGYRKKLYEIQADFQVGTTVLPFASCGCGGDLVLGSLHTTHQYKISPKERIELALDAAEEFSCGVRGPHTILSI